MFNFVPMKQLVFLISFSTLFTFASAQDLKPTDKQRTGITSLIDQYSLARENRDTVLLKKILTNEVDQLVSNGAWRDGIASSVNGMLASSASAPGTRSLTVDKLRMLSSSCAIVDCRYEIKNEDGTMRKMWSTFLVVLDKKQWKISAIRNMLPAK
jgi:hypothetical protein